MQVESRAGIAALDDILAVDGVFIGPSDLSADMGYPGDINAPEVQDTIRDALGRIAAAGKAPGIMSIGDGTPPYLAAGARFIAVAVDVVMLTSTARAVSARWTGKSQAKRAG